jgi:hypothetical protein
MWVSFFPVDSMYGLDYVCSACKIAMRYQMKCSTISCHSRVSSLYGMPSPILARYTRLATPFVAIEIIVLTVAS